MYPILFYLGNFPIYSHGVMIVLGMIVGGAITTRFLSRTIPVYETFMEVILASLFGGILGARILYLLLYSNQFSSFKDMMSFWNGGMVSFGGAIGGILAAGLVLKLKKEPVLKWLDFSIFGLMIGWAIGRIGCFLNGDSVGIYTTSILAIWGRYQTALFESIWLVLISGFLYCFYQKNKNVWPSGIIFSLAIGLYGFGRFLIDFVQDEPIWFWHLRYGQIGSISTLVFAIILILVIMERERKTKIK